MLKGCFIGDEASIKEELHELTKPHSVGLGLGEGGVDEVEPLLIVRLEEDGIVGGLRHLKYL